MLQFRLTQSTRTYIYQFEYYFSCCWRIHMNIKTKSAQLSWIDQNPCLETDIHIPVANQITRLLVYKKPYFYIHTPVANTADYWLRFTMSNGPSRLLYLHSQTNIVIICRAYFCGERVSKRPGTYVVVNFPIILNHRVRLIKHQQ